MNISLKNLNTFLLLTSSIVIFVVSLIYYLKNIDFIDYTTSGLSSFNIGPLLALTITLLLTKLAGKQFLLFWFFSCAPVFIYSLFIESQLLTEAYIVLSIFYTYFVLCIFFFNSIKTLAIVNHRLKFLNWFIGLVLTLFVLIVMSEMKPSLNIFDFYDARFAARNYSIYFQYALVLTQNVVLPLVLWKYYKTKNIMFIATAFSLTVILFLAAGIRNNFLLFFIIVVCSFYLNRYPKVDVYRFAAIILLAISSLLLFVHVEAIKPVVELFVRRTLIATGYWANIASNFDYSYGTPLSIQLGEYYIGGGHNSNLNPFNTGLIELGVAKFITILTFAAFLISYINKAGFSVVVLWMLLIFSNLRVQSWFITGGLILLFLITIFYYESKREKCTYLSVDR